MQNKKCEFWQEWLSIVLLKGVSTPVNMVLTSFSYLKTQNMDQASAKNNQWALRNLYLLKPNIVPDLYSAWHGFRYIVGTASGLSTYIITVLIFFLSAHSMTETRDKTVQNNSAQNVHCTIHHLFLNLIHSILIQLCFFVLAGSIFASVKDLE